jgi:hypothetical protein
VFERKFVLFKLLLNLIVTKSTLASTLVLLDQSDCANDFHVQRERVMNDFFHGIGARVNSWFGLELIQLAHKGEFSLLHGHLFFGNLVVVSLLLLLFLGFLLFLFLACIAFNLLFESELNFDIVFLSKVARYWDFDD